MRRTAIMALAAALAALALAGCGPDNNAGGPTGTTVAQGPTAQTTTSNTSTPTAQTSTPAGGATGSAVATNLDPCQIVPASEASQLAGASYGTGKEETMGDDGKGKLCVYGYQTTNVFEVDVVQAADAQTAASNWDADRNELNSELSKAAEGAAGFKVGFNFTDVSGIGDRAATGKYTASIQGVTLSGSGFYLIKGAVFVAFTDLQLGGGAPSTTALTTEAKTVVGRLP